MHSSSHKRTIKNFATRAHSAAKKVLSSNPLLPFSVFLLLIGVTAGIVLTGNSTELRQQAAYAGCKAPSVQIVGGVDDGGCRCPNGDVIDPGKDCPTIVPTATLHLISSPMCIQDGQIIGQGGAICCSGQTYQRDNDVICGLRPNSTCTGSCVSSTKGTCSEIGRYTAVGTCVEKVGENMLCCGTSIAYSPTPLPTPLCTTGQYRCVGNTEYYCYSPYSEAAKSCGNYGCNGNRCTTPTPLPTKTPLPTATPICITGNYRCVNNIEHYCFGGGETSTRCGYGGCDPAGYKCRDSSCTGANGTVIDRNANTYCCNGKIQKGICVAFQLSDIGESCQSINNCSAGLICASGKCVECVANTCVDGKWCGSDSLFTYNHSNGLPLTCTRGQKSCDNWDSGICTQFTPTPPLTPAPTSINASCRQNSDCAFGYLCLRDAIDNTFACQPEQRTRDCWTYNFSTNKCESFKSYSGISCPIGSSPNSDICVNPNPAPGRDKIRCIAGRPENEGQYCLGNHSVTCNSSGETSITACPEGCNNITGHCNNAYSCTPGRSWCDPYRLNTLYTCHQGLLPYTAQETCGYGCNFSEDSCYRNPSSLSYVETLEQSLEQRYNINIFIGGNVTGIEQPSNTEFAYATLLQYQDILNILPAVYTEQVRFIEIYPRREGNTPGYTLSNGFVGIEECSNDPNSMYCRQIIIHEIGHNTEDLIVQSEACGESSSCTAMEGFVSAAENDQNPLFFNSDGSLNLETSIIDGFGDNVGWNYEDGANTHDRGESADHLNVLEFFANFQTYYFTESETFKITHPNIYAFFQDLYHEYPN